MTTALTIRVSDEQITALEDIARQCNLQVLNTEGQFRQAFAMAAGIRALEERITDDMMKDVMALQNNALGFKTDKKDGGYPVQAVKRCLIEAVLRGVRPVNNEFNIIADHCYVTKDGFKRLCNEFPGVTDIRMMPSIPRMKEGGAIVEYRATWNQDGKPQSLERVGDQAFPVKVNSATGADAIVGKATRKMYAAMYAQMSGVAVPDGEVEGDIIDVPHEKKAQRSSANDALNEANGHAEQPDDPIARILPKIEAAETDADLHSLEDAYLGDGSALSPDIQDVVRANIGAKRGEIRAARTGKATQRELVK